MPSSPPVILTIAGSDSCSGAGLQADLKAIGAHGGYGICAVTAVVSEVPGVVSKVMTLESDLLADQLEILVDHYPIAAIKTGMLGNSELCEVVANFLDEHSSKLLPVVVDPVMVATSGGSLLAGAAIETYRQRILPHARVATPNLDEAAVLLEREISDVASMESAAREFHERYRCPVIIKGGHLEAATNDATDILFDGETIIRESTPRLADIGTHGTGCTFSAALATILGKESANGNTGAQGDLASAFTIAKSYITDAIAQSHHWPQPGNIHALNHRPENVA